MGGRESAARARSNIARAGLVAIPLLTLPAISWFETDDAVPAATVTIERARFVVSDSATPPPATAEGWREVSLPHEWREADPGARAGWYRVSVTADEEGRGIYLRHVIMHVDLFLNGERLADRERLAGNEARLANRPLFFDVPKDLLRTSENVIDVHVRAGRGDGLLGPLYLSSAEELGRIYQRRRHIEVTTVQVIFVCLVVVAVAIGALWSYRRAETEYGWLALFLLAWALHVGDLIVVRPPLPPALWDWLNAVAMGWTAIFVTLFLRRFLGDEGAPHTRTVVIAGVIGSAALGVVAAADEGWFRWIFAHVWLTAALALPALPASRIFVALRARGGIELELLAAASLTLVTCILRDWLHFQGLLPRQYGEYAQFAAPAVLGAAGWIIVSRFARALGEAEAMAATLEDRVREKERDLEHTYARIADLERARILADERERIQREMHDGIGGRLVSALAVIDGSSGKADAVSGMLRRAIGDLRLVVDAVGSEPRELTAVLGSLRERLQTDLRAVGVELEWRVEDAPSSLGPAQSLHVTRIVEEAIANVVRHAGATKVVLRTSMEAGGEAVVEISDDGRGIRPGAPPGRGLANMWRRATEIGARLELGSAGKGTTIRLRLPRRLSPESGMTSEANRA